MVIWVKDGDLIQSRQEDEEKSVACECRDRPVNAGTIAADLGAPGRGRSQ